MAVGSNISFTINRNTDKAQSDLSSSFRKLSSGFRINKASDDAAGLAIAEALNASVVSLGQASRNIGDITSLTEIADGALDQISQLASRKAELATQAANGTYSDTQRSALQAENQALSEEITRITETTEFNGVKVFQGSSITAQVGEDGSSNSQLSTGSLDISTLVSSISSNDISTQAGAQAAIDSIKTFTDEISSKRGDIGALQSRLDSASESVETKKIGQQGALSRIRDLDVAEEVSNSIRASILSQSGPALLAQASKLNSNTIKTLLG